MFKVLGLCPFITTCSPAYQGLELQCLLKVKQDLRLVLIFQNAILNAKYIAWIDMIDVVFVVKDIIVISEKLKPF